MHTVESPILDRKVRARAERTERMRAIALRKRGGRILVAARRAFIVSSGEPILARDVLARAYPRLKRFTYWQRWSVRRALLQVAEPIARNRFGKGRPILWSPVQGTRGHR